MNAANAVDIGLAIENLDMRRAERGQVLPSGRTITLKVSEAGEELQIRSATGHIEVCITLGDAGPVVRLSGARLELEAPHTIALHCRRLEVNTEDRIHLKSAGSLEFGGQEMRVQTTGDIHLNGDVIRLNCSPDSLDSHHPSAGGKEG
jgi:hypothetical protein